MVNSSFFHYSFSQNSLFSSGVNILIGGDSSLLHMQVVFCSMPRGSRDLHRHPNMGDILIIFLTILGIVVPYLGDGFCHEPALLRGQLC